MLFTEGSWTLSFMGKPKEQNRNMSAWADLEVMLLKEKWNSPLGYSPTPVFCNSMILSWEQLYPPLHLSPPLTLPWSPGDIWQHLKTLDCYCSGVEGWVIPKSGEWRPGTLLNILQSIGQAPTTKIFSFKMWVSPLLRTPIVLLSRGLGLGALALSGSPAHQSCDL